MLLDPRYGYLSESGSLLHPKLTWHQYKKNKRCGDPFVRHGAPDTKSKKDPRRDPIHMISDAAIPFFGMGPSTMEDLP